MKWEALSWVVFVISRYTVLAYDNEGGVFEIGWLDYFR